MNSIDLSFTKDPVWIENRTLIWKPIEKNLSTDFSEKEILDVAQYFYTGNPGESYLLDDSGKFEYFPLQGRDAWDYILSNIVPKSSVFEDLVKGTLQDRSNEKFFPHMAPYELERWDYFFGDEFEPVVKSRVPVGNEQKLVSLNLDLCDVFCRMSPLYLGFLERGKGGDDPKWIKRSKYYWSMFPYLKNDFFNADEGTDEADSIYFVRRLFSCIVNIKIKKPYEDPNRTRTKFISEMEEEVEGMYSSLCSGIQKLWDEAKSQKKLENN